LASSDHNGIKLDILKNQCVTEVIRDKIKKFLESNENTMYQNLWDIAKAMLREQFITICAYIKKKKQRFLK
jgi:hypothetical protein